MRPLDSSSVISPSAVSGLATDPAADHVRIHIDQHAYHSPNPTTGSALYALGKVPADLVLFKEVQGNREDKPVPRTGHEIRLKNDDHFHSAKASAVGHEIFVEGAPHHWLKEHISYAEVVTLEVPDYPQHPEITYSVKYKNGPAQNPEGVLAPGGSVKVKDGMKFSVHSTGQS